MPIKQHTVGGFIITKFSIFSVFVVLNFFVFCIPLFSFAIPIEFNDQPSGKYSILSGERGGRIKDEKFAKLMKTLFQDNGVSSATFLFQQCYGGGMLDDLQDTLNSSGIKWVGGSAGKFSDVTYGQDSPTEFDKKEESPDERNKKVSKLINDSNKLKATFVNTNPHGFWTKELLSELPKETNSIRDALIKAGTNDKLGVNADEEVKKVSQLYRKKQDKETGQIVFGNGGETIVLNEKDAKSHHAIIWVDNPNRERHRNNALSVIDILIKEWGKPESDVSITVLGGSGDKNFRKVVEEKTGQAPIRASNTKLADTIETLKKKLNNDEQFLFYATGHGSWGVEDNKKKSVKAESAHTGELKFLDGEVEGMLIDPFNMPTFSVEYEDLVYSAPIYFNDYLLGLLYPVTGDVGMSEFAIPEDLIGSDNVFRIENLGTVDFSVVNTNFYSGAITDMLPPIVPEPETIWLFGFGLLGLIGLKKAKMSIKAYRDRSDPHRPPLPHHAAYGSVMRGSADQAESDPGGRKPK